MKYLITDEFNVPVKEVRCPEQFISLQYDPTTQKCWTLPDEVPVPEDLDNAWLFMNATLHLEDKK